MSPRNAATSEIDRWSPEVARTLAEKVGRPIRRYFRAELHGRELLPVSGGALLVSNHSGGMFTPDIFLFAPPFYEHFGYSRRLYTLGHDTIFIGPLRDWLPRAGVVHATRDNATEALQRGAVVLVFPGGDHDSYRPTSASNVIDFNGRTGYVRTALEAGVPIVPMVSVGGQETQLFLTRGRWLAQRLGLNRARMEALPITVGFPFGLSMFIPPNLPLPVKIVTQLLPPVDIAAEFGAEPKIDEVDAHIRDRMQIALNELARRRKFPIIG
ncbi:glycerol acyltransferase [Mycobacteriaceae bacterium 1482268.1]|nr:glycerol acyltransferase [Mycobacteriaceae bacterium 1482268.1]